MCAMAGRLTLSELAALASPVCALINIRMAQSVVRVLSTTSEHRAHQPLSRPLRADRHKNAESSRPGENCVDRTDDDKQAQRDNRDGGYFDSGKSVRRKCHCVCLLSEACARSLPLWLPLSPLKS